MTRHWSTAFLNSGVDFDATSTRRALIILNQPFHEELLKRLWRTTSWKACADGGANMLFDTTQKFEENKNNWLPDLIKGDLDSVRPEVKEHYERLGVSVIKDPDQDATDLMKCVKALEELEESETNKPQFEIILLGGLSGRFDQTIHVVSYMHKLRKQRKHFYVVTNDSIGWCLDEGEHVIEIDPNLEGTTCGLLPIGIDSARIKTQGLQWNLDNRESSFDGLVSSSNSVVSKEVFVLTSRPIFWTMELSSLWASDILPRYYGKQASLAGCIAFQQRRLCTDKWQKTELMLMEGHIVF